jgi:hypothetical protein
MHRFDPEVEGIALTVQAHQQRPRKSSCDWKIKKNVGCCMGFLGLGRGVWDGLGWFSFSFSLFALIPSCFVF